jgi:hypothetical protein
LAERVMRILVMIRKNWGGNRSENGARAQAILTNVLCTARQQEVSLLVRVDSWGWSLSGCAGVP